jgi:hypothetical protein
MEVALDPTAVAEPTVVEAAPGLAAAAGMMVVMMAGMVVEATNNATGYNSNSKKIPAKLRGFFTVV